MPDTFFLCLSAIPAYATYFFTSFKSLWEYSLHSIYTPSESSSILSQPFWKILSCIDDCAYFSEYILNFLSFSEYLAYPDAQS